MPQYAGKEDPDRMLDFVSERIYLKADVVFSGQLSSANQDTNDAIRVYQWAGSITDPRLTTNGFLFTAQQACLVELSAQIVVLNATANDRAAFELYVEVEDEGGAELRRYGLGGCYIRDDSSLYDSGAAGGGASVWLEAGQSLSVVSRRLDSQDRFDDNPASQTRSRLVLTVPEVVKVD